MGSFGPVRVITEAPNSTRAAPYRVVNNDETLLDKSDLVFLDMIGAGYSRPLARPSKAPVQRRGSDVDAFVRAIRRYITINNR